MLFELVQVFAVCGMLQKGSADFLNRVNGEFNVFP